jgi:hypothetical protein
MSLQSQMPNHGEHYARGPYYGDRTLVEASTNPQPHLRYDSTHDVNYADDYHMPLRKVFHGNNGRTNVNACGGQVQ